LYEMRGRGLGQYAGGPLPKRTGRSSKKKGRNGKKRAGIREKKVKELTAKTKGGGRMTKRKEGRGKMVRNSVSRGHSRGRPVVTEMKARGQRGSEIVQRDQK